MGEPERDFGARVRSGVFESLRLKFGVGEHMCEVSDFGVAVDGGAVAGLEDGGGGVEDWAES